MKTIVRLLATVAVLAGFLHAQSPRGKIADEKKPESKQRGSAQSIPPLSVPPEVMDLAQEARALFERGNFAEAEKCYDKALAIAPDNLYLLSNKGVVLLSQRKYQLAEEALKKAITVAPEDDFSRFTLGVVECQQGKFDEALSELTKVLALNPKNAAAHNYLGIVASQKGWSEAAQKEFQTATSIEPNYADAYFNLAIALSRQTPPNKEGARARYKRAIELGATPDTDLEQLIK